MKLNALNFFLKIMIYHLLSSLLFSCSVLALTIVIALVSIQCSCNLIMVNKLQFHGQHIECLCSSFGLCKPLLSHTQKMEDTCLFS